MLKWANVHLIEILSVISIWHNNNYVLVSSKINQLNLMTHPGWFQT